MKLKKIASLALAGVMAVSMLAGCATNKPEEKPGEGEGTTTTTTGYSAELGKYLDLDKDYVTYADNKDDQAALVKALGQMDDATIYSLNSKQDAYDMVGTIGNKNVSKALADLKDTLDLEADPKTTNLNFAALDETNIYGTIKHAALYVINGGMSDEAVMQAVANKVKNQLADNAGAQNLPESTPNGFAVARDYNYTVSASVVNKAKTQVDANGIQSATFILVTVTRTSTAG